jgi:hypothetical protein
MSAPKQGGTSYAPGSPGVACSLGHDLLRHAERRLVSRLPLGSAGVLQILYALR